MKHLFSIFLSLFTIAVFAQKSFFETLDAHGANAKYLNFGEVYNNDDGKQQTSNGAPRKTEVIKMEALGLPSGVEIFTTYKDGERKRTNWYDVTKESKIEFIGFPNTSMVYHGGYNRAYVAVGNYVFFLEGITKDKLRFNEITRAFVLVGAKANNKSDKPKKKKKGFGKFLKKVKDAAVSGNSDPRYSQPKGPEYDALMSQDVKQMVKDYLKAIKAKQDAYTMTAKDKEDLATLKNAAKEYDEYVRDKNAAYWKSSEGQAILRNRKNVKSAEARHMKYCRLTKESCGAVIHPSY